MYLSKKYMPVFVMDGPPADVDLARFNCATAMTQLTVSESAFLFCR